MKGEELNIKNEKQQVGQRLPVGKKKASASAQRQPPLPDPWLMEEVMRWKKSQMSDGPGLAQTSTGVS